MIEVIDRIPTYPGRIKLIPVPGQQGVYDMIRADEPIEDGTPINRSLFDSIDKDISTINQNVVNLVNAHTSISAIGGLAAGAEFGLYENNLWIPFIKVSGEYGGTGRSAVMRKDVYSMDLLNVGFEGNRYAEGYMDTWLNNEYVAMLESRVQAALEPVTITCTRGKGVSGLETIDRKVFIASITEYGITDSQFNVEGTAFPYFNSYERRKAMFNGTYVAHWTRSAHRTVNGWTGFIDNGGGHGTDNPGATQRGIRPVFTLPHDFEVNIDSNMTANVMATAEVI